MIVFYFLLFLVTAIELKIKRFLFPIFAYENIICLDHTQYPTKDVTLGTSRVDIREPYIC
jgi:hypothetical protein